MPICPDCKSSELVQWSANSAYMACTMCKALFKLYPVSRAKASTLDHDATQSHSLLSKGLDHSNIASVATAMKKQAKLTLAEKRGRSNIQT